MHSCLGVHRLGCVGHLYQRGSNLELAGTLGRSRGDMVDGILGNSCLTFGMFDLSLEDDAWLLTLVLALGLALAVLLATWRWRR